jgi:hypothetical protein
MLANAKTPQEANQVVKDAKAFAEVLRSLGAGNAVVNRAVLIGLEAFEKLGEMLGPLSSQRGRTKSLPEGVSHKNSSFGKRWRFTLDPTAKRKFLERFENEEPTELDEVASYAAAMEFLKRYERAQREGAPGELYEPSFESEIRHCSMKELLSDPTVQPDWIITDPPYPEEFIHLFGELASHSRKIPMAVMSGQYHLGRVLNTMTEHRSPRWVMCYLTPGDRHHIFPAQLQTGWKPVILFGGSEWITDDVVTSKSEDKRFHDWGQSVSGTAGLVERLTNPGQLVCDPFVGGGSTAVACALSGRRFIGCDISEEAVNVSRLRVREVLDDNVEA